jgi:hypothetical protein
MKLYHPPTTGCHKQSVSDISLYSCNKRNDPPVNEMHINPIIYISVSQTTFRGTVLFREI